jgi:deazaflavin-dependent oxidoreductase (nitroreductase family)
MRIRPIRELLNRQLGAAREGLEHTLSVPQPAAGGGKRTVPAMGAEDPSTHTLPYVDPYRRRGRLYLAACRLATTRAGVWLASRIAWNVDPLLLKLTRGRFSSTGPVASALLETRGARTGKPRRTATLYFHDGDRVTIIPSKIGAPEHPGWYYNLRKNPDVLYGGLPFHAEIVEDEAERRRLWDLADRVFPGFAVYREWAARSGRVIPIAQLTPR